MRDVTKRCESPMERGALLINAHYHRVFVREFEISFRLSRNAHGQNALGHRNTLDCIILKTHLLQFIFGSPTGVYKVRSNAPKMIKHTLQVFTLMNGIRIGFRSRKVLSSCPSVFPLVWKYGTDALKIIRAAYKRNCAAPNTNTFDGK